MSELPSGTVTFLFSDIEGSTAAAPQLGDGWGDVLGDHRRLLRDAFSAGGGREVDTQGDAFFFAFPRAGDATDGAAAGQRALCGHDWPDDVELRVRMGLHTGEPSMGEEGYLGIDVVRAARICSAAHGAQVLVSETTRALVGGDDFVDLGPHRLKDLDDEQRLFQLVGAGLPSEFPPLRTLDLQPAVPAPPLPLDFAGREEDYAQRARELTVQIHSQVSEKLARDLADVPGVDLSSLGIPGPPPAPPPPEPRPRRRGLFRRRK